MILTREIMRKARSSLGGWSKAQLACFGLDTPCPTKMHSYTPEDMDKLAIGNWKTKIVGKDWPEETIARFIALKDAHLSPVRIEVGLKIKAIRKIYREQKSKGINNSKAEMNAIIRELRRYERAEMRRRTEVIEQKEIGNCRDVICLQCENRLKMTSCNTCENHSGFIKLSKSVDITIESNIIHLGFKNAEKRDVVLRKLLGIG